MRTKKQHLPSGKWLLEVYDDGRNSKQFSMLYNLVCKIGKPVSFSRFDIWRFA